MTNLKLLYQKTIIFKKLKIIIFFCAKNENIFFSNCNNIFYNVNKVFLHSNI